MKEKEFGKNTSSGAEKVENIARKIAESGVADYAAWNNTTAGVGLSNGQAMFGGLGAGLPLGINAMGEEPVEGMGNGAETAEQERKAAERRVAEARARLREKEEKKRNQEKENSEKKSAYHYEKSPSQSGQNGGHGGDHGNGRKDNGGKKRGDGLGGWIAAVVSLGAVSLVLTAVVTVGAIRMSKAADAAAAAYRGTMYEFIHVVEEADDDLAALRIATDPKLQAELLTDILVQTRMAEADLEKLPIDTKAGENTMRFFNGVSAYCERTLDRLSRGEKLSERDIERLEELYEVMREVRDDLDELAAEMEDDDMKLWMKGKDCCIEKTLQTVDNTTAPRIQSGKEKPEKKQKDGGRDGMNAQPSGAKMQDRAGIPSQKAEELCKQYFSDYGVTETTYAGETLGKGLKAYNFEMETESGVGMFAQISQDNGALIYFDYFAECSKHVYDVETAKNTALAFLTKLGYEDMIPVDVKESGTNADFTFVYYADGCAYYPDEIVVKVCEERGLVSGFDASKYLKNHKGRGELNTKISMQQAKDGLSDKLTVESARTVLFDHRGKEWTAYEFFCAYDGELYFIYVDAMDGRELYIVNSKNM